MGGDDAYPVGRMCFQVAFLSVLGTIYAWSTWSPAFAMGPFPYWTVKELGFVYSLGIFGAFATPLGGVLYDWGGPSATYLVGLLMALAGAGGLAVVVHFGEPAGAWSSIVVGVLYYLEEQGSSTLYMGIALDTLVHFPARNVSMSMGVVALGYSLSSVFTSLIVARFNPSIPTFFLSLCVLFTVFGIFRLVVLGDIGSSASQKQQGAEGPSVAEITASPHFRQIILYSVLCLVPCTVLLSLLKLVGDANGESGAALAQAALVTNCVGRLVVGWLFDMYRRALTSQDALLAVLFGSTVGFGVLLLQTAEFLPTTCLWVGVMVVTFLFGGTSPIVGAYVKDHFPASASGTVFGLHQVSIAIGNLLWNMSLFPTTTALPAGFLRPFAGAFVVSGLGVASAVPEMLSRDKAKM